ncbi:DUF2938 domain-containing protein [Sphingobacterium yanglingense]|uniref:DUF2938 family protein n=1 Tax=Sphingobacterium yanglingense TaxID=1437280 RepID=A0A4R6WIC0_9SPHI|nr:DUF2938 domain-containing protein [Sphingobacterium yanglingense]TDQ77316.1 Protein of unknown function (DUF2938) [Sphingobacterium yanglingense]
MITLVYALILGVGATVIMDVFALIIKKIWQIPSLDYALLGRWLGHISRGTFRHSSIIQATPFYKERQIGWLAHYTIGIAFAYLLLLIWGVAWLTTPTFWPAMIIGLGTTLAPWFIMQPAFGFGVAASKTPNPPLARFRSLQAHFMYGLGLYLTGWIMASLLF